MVFMITESKISDKLDKLDNNQNVSTQNSWLSSSFYTNTTITTMDIQEKELIKKYRQYKGIAKVDDAIKNITTEAVVIDDTESIGINVDEIRSDDKKTERIWKENLPDKFDEVLNILDWNNYGDDYFDLWYTDGRLYVYYETDKYGLKYVKILDPLRLFIKVDINEKKYYEYNVSLKFFESDYNFEQPNNDDIITIPEENMLFVPSGLTKNGIVISYLNKAIRPINLLQMMENSLVVYRFVRSPERWVFKIDVGGMSRANAESYMQELQRNYRQKFSMDTITGEVSSQNAVMSMMENFWFPKTRSQNQGHDISTVGGQLCLDMNTLVKLLDGRDLSIREIEKELSEGKELWTYSCHPKTGEIVPGIITWAGVTQKSAKVLKITLDNNESIICTPEHKFPIYGTGFTEAKDLKIGDSLIPLYTKKQKMYDKMDYEMVFKNDVKKWEYTHRMVANYLKNDLVSVYQFNTLNTYEKFGTIHHKNFNRFNNSPNNLCFMNNKDHFYLHNEYATNLVEYMKEFRKDDKKMEEYKTKWKESIKKHYEYEENRIRQSNNMKEFYKNNPERIEEFSNYFKIAWDNIISDEQKYNEFCEKVSLGIQKYYENISDEDYKNLCDRNKIKAKMGGNSYANLMKTNENFRKQQIDATINYWAQDGVKEKHSINQKLLLEELWKNKGEELRKNHKEKQKINITNNILNYIRELIKDKTTHQFTIKDVITNLNSNELMLNEFKLINSNKCTPNYDLSLGFTETIIKRCVKDFGYSNWTDFRKKEGLHNHKIAKIEYLDEEIEVGTLTIDGNEKYHNYHTFALSCGVFTKNSGLGEINDVLYFQKEMYKSLNVPVSRLDTQNSILMGSKGDEINRDELMFFKFIKYLRRRFNVLFTSLLREHIVASGFAKESQWEEIKEGIKFKYSNDNFYEQAKEKARLESRLELLGTYETYLLKYYGPKYVRTKILQQTEVEIEEYDKDIEEHTKKMEEINNSNNNNNSNEFNNQQNNQQDSYE